MNRDKKLLWNRDKEELYPINPLLKSRDPLDEKPEKLETFFRKEDLIRGVLFSEIIGTPKGKRR